MILFTVLSFCRITIGLTFGLSFLKKALDTPIFGQTIAHFALLPKRFSPWLARLLLGSELMVTILLALGGTFLNTGFLLAIILLLLFCGAIISVLHRNIQAPCNCFGSSHKVVSVADVWRNVGLLICALLGYIALVGSQGNHQKFNLVEWCLVGLGSAAFVSLWLHLDEIVRVFQPD